MAEQPATGLRILPPVFFVLALGAMVLLHYALPGPRWLADPWRLLGSLLVFAAVTWVICAAVLFRIAGTAIKPYEQSSALVTEGPYRVTRNPMYLGMVVTLLGAGIMLGTTIPFIVVPLFAALIQARFILMEEGMLEAAFGQAYRDYKAKVRRWI